MKGALDLIKRGIRHASLRAKPSNIVTPDNFEREEIRMYSRQIKEIESLYKQLILHQKNEDEKNQLESNFDLL